MNTTLLAIIGIAAVLAVGITATVQSVFAQAHDLRGYHGNGCRGEENCAGPSGGVGPNHFAPGTSGCAPPGQVKPAIC